MPFKRHDEIDFFPRVLSHERVDDQGHLWQMTWNTGDVTQFDLRWISPISAFAMSYSDDPYALTISGDTYDVTVIYAETCYRENRRSCFELQQLLRENGLLSRHTQIAERLGIEASDMLDYITGKQKITTMIWFSIFGVIAKDLPKRFEDSPVVTLKAYDHPSWQALLTVIKDHPNIIALSFDQAHGIYCESEISHLSDRPTDRWCWKPYSNAKSLNDIGHRIIQSMPDELRNTMKVEVNNLVNIVEKLYDFDQSKTQTGIEEFKKILKDKFVNDHLNTIKIPDEDNILPEHVPYEKIRRFTREVLAEQDELLSRSLSDIRERTQLISDLQDNIKFQVGIICCIFDHYLDFFAVWFLISRVNKSISYLSGISKTHERQLSEDRKVLAKGNRKMMINDHLEDCVLFYAKMFLKPAYREGDRDINDLLYNKSFINSVKHCWNLSTKRHLNEKDYDNLVNKIQLILDKRSFQKALKEYNPQLKVIELFDEAKKYILITDEDEFHDRINQYVSSLLKNISQDSDVLNAFFDRRLQCHREDCKLAQKQQYVSEEFSRFYQSEKRYNRYIDKAADVQLPPARDAIQR